MGLPTERGQVRLPDLRGILRRPSNRIECHLTLKNTSQV